MTRLSKTASRQRHTTKPERQQGSALLIGLLILLTMTLIGLSSLNTSLLEEKMASNTQKKTIAFQDAEATINDAIRIVSKPADTYIIQAINAYDSQTPQGPAIVKDADSPSIGDATLNYTGQQLPAGYSMDKFTANRLEFLATGQVEGIDPNKVSVTNRQGTIKFAPKP